MEKPTRNVNRFDRFTREYREFTVDSAPQLIENQFGGLIPGRKRVFGLKPFVTDLGETSRRRELIDKVVDRAVRPLPRHDRGRPCHLGDDLPGGIGGKSRAFAPGGHAGHHAEHPA